MGSSILNTAKTRQRARKVAANVSSATTGAASLDDPDNPEWTRADFTNAKGAEDLSAAELAAFPKSKRRGRPPGTTKVDAKRSITLRLDPDVLEKFKATGSGWQSRINEVLKSAEL